MLETIKTFFSGIWGTIINYLPGSPFTAFIDSLETIPYLPELNWFVPVGEMIAIIEVWLTAVALYYVYQALMRFVHLL